MWKKDKKFSDRFLVEIKRILGEHLLGENTEEDIFHNSDLVVLGLRDIRVGCRVRRYKYFEEYGHQFTIRRGRPSGRKSELAKIIEGWGDYFLYGFGCELEKQLFYWTLCDLNVFRLWHGRTSTQLPFGRMPGDDRKANHDGSSNFIAYNFTSLPDEFIIARGGL